MYLLTIKPTFPLASEYQIASMYKPIWGVLKRYLAKQVENAHEDEGQGIYDIDTPSLEAALHIVEALVELDIRVRLGSNRVLTLAGKKATVTLAWVSVIKAF